MMLEVEGGTRNWCMKLLRHEMGHVLNYAYKLYRRKKWQKVFGKFPQEEPRIATFKAKWDYDYRQRWNIQNIFTGRLPEGLREKIESVCKRAYRVLNMHNYARFDIRVSKAGHVYILEANANPSLDKDDELAQSAKKGGLSYNQLIKKIIALAFKRV